MDGYDGKCPICGSTDGMIGKGHDGKFRNMCRVMGCPAFYRPAPAVGFDTIEECRDPWSSTYLKDRETMSAYEYLTGQSEPPVEEEFATS